jgi:hypothetical protein
MREPLSVITKWMVSGGDVLEPPPLVQAAYRQVAREEEALSQHYVEWSPAAITPLLEMVDQQRLEFEEEDEHKNVRLAVARYIETVIIQSICYDERVWKLPRRLREARETGTLMYRPADQRWIAIADDKAGLPLLCPDDSREEGMRITRRYVPTISAWRNNGKAIHKLVLNPPNIPRGQLREGMRELFKTFNKIFFKSGKFPEVKGALVSLEAPMSKLRNWNVHLNVILLCDGFLDYDKIVAHWGHQFDAKRLHGDVEQIEAALREVIKYAVQAMPSKSLEHQRRGISEAPAMLEWTAEEWLEWWDAHQRFRRTRSYGALYGIKEPEPESMEGFVGAGSFWHKGTRIVRRIHLLDSIPGDKSSNTSLVDRYRKAIERLRGPPDEALRCLELAQQAERAWQQIENR